MTERDILHDEQAEYEAEHRVDPYEIPIEREDPTDSGLNCYFCQKPIHSMPRWTLAFSEPRPAHEVCRQEWVSGADDHSDWDDDLQYDDAAEYLDAMDNRPEWY